MSANEKLTRASSLKTLAERLQAQVNAAVAAADHLKRKKVTSLDAIDSTAANADKYIYMVPKTSSGADDLYDEYMVLDGKLEHIGNTQVDMTGYVQAEAGKGLSEANYTSSEKTKLSGIAEGATKVTASDTAGAINVNGTAIQVVDIATDAEISAMLDEVFGA